MLAALIALPNGHETYALCVVTVTGKHDRYKSTSTLGMIRVPSTTKGDDDDPD